MYDAKANLEADQQKHAEEEEQREEFDFDDDGIDYSVPIVQNKPEKTLPEPEPFNPEIDESTLDISAIKKEFFGE